MGNKIYKLTSCEHKINNNTGSHELIANTNNNNNVLLNNFILYSIKDTAIVFRPVDIFNALKSTKTGKACGVDGLAAEHFIHASPIIHVY